MKYPFAVLCLLGLMLIPACTADHDRVYENKSFDFSVRYPSSYKIKEFKTDGLQTGAELKSDKGIIDIRAGAAGTDYEKMPFDEYVRIAAPSEIQNYENLVSIESFTSDSGIKGYKTCWRVIETIPPDVKTISISSYSFKENDPGVFEDLGKIARSFR